MAAGWPQSSWSRFWPGSLAGAAASGQATLSVDAATLKRRAKEAYERAIAADSEDRRSRDGLTRLDGSQ